MDCIHHFVANCALDCYYLSILYCFTVFFYQLYILSSSSSVSKRMGSDLKKQADEIIEEGHEAVEEEEGNNF